MDRSQNCVFLILFANQREGNPQSPGIQVNRKHHQVTKHLKRSAETQGGVGNSPPLPFCRAQWAVGVWAKTTKQTTCKSHSATGNVQWRKVSSMSGNLRVIWQLALFFSKPWLPETLLLPCWLQNCTPLACAPSEAAVNALSQLTDGACCLLQWAPHHWQDAAEVGLKVETAQQPALCGLVTTVAPSEPRNQHVLTSAPSGPVEQWADRGTRALHAYVHGTIAAGPGFPLHPLVFAPQEK